MIADLTSREIDVAILWGPMAGYHAGLTNPRMRVTLLIERLRRPAACLSHRHGGSPDGQNWKRLLNRLIAENRTDINRLLIGFGVPLLDENDQLITTDAPAK